VPVLSGAAGYRGRTDEALHLDRMCLDADMTGADRAALDFAIDRAV